MKNSLVIGVLLSGLALCLGCSTQQDVNENPSSEEVKHHIDSLLDAFHLAAGEADFTSYFNFYSEEAIFTGTDASERWNKPEFMAYAKPYFDKGKAWNFKAITRTITLHESGEIAWFDELLDTQMKLCRGSGVLVKKENSWKIEQYILSMTVPNDVAGAVIETKRNLEGAYLDSITALTKQN